ncbi:MAG: MFS transporter [Sulfuritalea sp.]|jgi:MFS family permease|nr:MFS transporter [Sulfuritalea sp.]
MKDSSIILLLCVAAVFSMTGFSTWPALLPELQAAWGLSGKEAGAIGGSYFAGYMLAVPLLSGLTDRIDARRVYVGACLLASVGHFGFALFAHDLVSACLLQAIGGAGLAGTYMPGLKALTDRVGGARLPRYIAFYTSTFGIGAAVSYALSGWIALIDWRAAFVFGGIGPFVAIGLILRGLAPVAPHGGHVPGVAAQLAVLKDRAVRGYVLGYAAHCWELFGLRSWIVGLLAFSATQGSLPLAPATAAAVINLVGIPASILGNEFAGHHNRRRTILTIMLASGALAWAVGAAASWPLALLALLLIYQVVVMADSAALTAGLVAVADPARRGAVMAVYSMAGFGAGFLSPLVAGAVLDAGGGSSSALGWMLATGSLGIWCLLAPLAIRR